jgi:hypothetical protein
MLPIQNIPQLSKIAQVVLLAADLLLKCLQEALASGATRWSHAGATHLAIVALIMAGRGCSPLKALFVPLFAAFDALLGALGGDIRQCLLVAARGHLPASRCGAKRDRLIAGGALGGDAAQLLE